MKTETITVFQDYLNSIPDYEKHIQNLYALRNIVGRNNFSLQADGTFQLMHYVGFFQKGNTRLQILPKIYSKTNLTFSNEPDLGTSLDFLYRLLYWSGFLNHKKLSPQQQSASSGDLLEIFIEIFITEFIALFSKKIHRNYIQQEENQQFIKGKILFSETIRRNPLLRHLHYVRFDEYTINNPLNQIFKALLLELLRKTNNSINKRNLVTGLTYLQEVDLVRLDTSLFTNIRFDRLNTAFEPLFNLARLFFNNSQPGLSKGEEKTFSFLVPVHLLFETFVAKILKSFTTDDLEYCYHYPQLYLGKDNGKDVFLLEPDFTILRHGKVITILDAKYKDPFDRSGNVAISTDDLYQLSTYALRYNCNTLFLIYPKFLATKIEESILADYHIQSGPGEIRLRIIQIDIMEDKLEKIIEKIRKDVSPYFNQQKST